MVGFIGAGTWNTPIKPQICQITDKLYHINTPQHEQELNLQTYVSIGIDCYDVKLNFNK